jgi:UDP-GlcNAc:undecaprenyl-phosphate GlcNAc-1-phosphate transferase
MAVFFVAFFVSFVATPVMRWLAIRNGVVDWPDFKRKVHLQPVAYLGGIAIFLGWLAGILMCFAITPHDARVIELGMTHVKFPFAIVIGGAVIALTGVIDDVYGVSPRVKIGGQLFAAAALATQDVGTELVADTFSSLGMAFPHSDIVAYVLGAIFIAVLVVGGCNSVNLLDGMDGLASGVAGIATCGFLVISLVVAIGMSNPDGVPPGIDLITSPVRIVMCLAILGTIMGFLPYNFNPANIFMGDAGSLLLGYLCVSTILLLAHAPGPGPALVMAALVVFAMPFTDTILAITRRKMAGRPIFSPDKAHLHHQIRKSGLTVKQTVLAMYALCLGFATIGCMMVFLRWRYVLAIFFVLFAFIAVTAIKSAQNKVIQAAIDPGARKDDEVSIDVAIDESGQIPRRGAKTHMPGAARPADELVSKDTPAHPVNTASDIAS